jgi:hypothetical protein
MELTYSKWITPYLKNFEVVVLSKEEAMSVEALALQIEEAKKSEVGYKNDGEGIYFRHLYGLYAEKAIEKKFDIKFIDYTVGNSAEYDHGDLKNVGCSHVGVKGLVLNYNNQNFHLITRVAIKCEILVFLEKLPEGEIKCYIAGMYTPDVLREYNTREGVKEGISLTKGYFYGICKYKKINSYNHIKKYNDEVIKWLEKNNIKTKIYA